MCFITIKGAIGFEFVAKNPLSRDDVGVGRSNEIPSSIGHESIILFEHSRVPIGVLEGTPICLRNGGKWCGISG